MEALLPVAHFRVFVGRRELACCEVGPLVSRTEDGAHAYEPVILRRALGGRELFEWRERVAAGKRVTRDVVIELLDGPAGRPVHAFVLREAWPVRWSGPALDALATGVACEEAALSFAALEWLDPGDRHPKPKPKETKRA
ncbi:MAG: hypothetical protein QOI80_2614 [Solirubrobacteraceae bacterium]|nr:hypothetical protein [Solirubrobacteraceae bacterium]